MKGKRSCHTGYGKSAGWKTPITKLVANDLMEVVVSDDAGYPNGKEEEGKWGGGGRRKRWLPPTSRPPSGTY